MYCTVIALFIVVEVSVNDVSCEGGDAQRPEIVRRVKVVFRSEAGYHLKEHLGIPAPFVAY